MQNCCWSGIKPITFFDVLACSHTLYYFFSLEIVESTYENKNCGVFFFSRVMSNFREKKKQANGVYVAAAIVLDKAPSC